MADVDALLVCRAGKGFRVMRQENRPTDILADVEAAATYLLSGVTAWIAATDRAALEQKMGTQIRAIQTRGHAA